MCEASRNANRQKIRLPQPCADASVRHGNVLRKSVAAVGGAPRRAATAAAGDDVPTFLTRAVGAPAGAAAGPVRRQPVPSMTEVTPGAT